MKTIDIGHTKIDIDRKARKGFSEVIFCEGKTPEQVKDIFSEMIKKNSIVLGTRADKKHSSAVKNLGVVYNETARLLIYEKYEKNNDKKSKGLIAVVSAGTSDMSVAEEAALTAEIMGSNVARHYDCGIAGLHRLTNIVDELQKANVVIAVAGMEGALPSVISGLISTPIIAVPTSVGYGASMKGISALLTMLNGCSPGVAVVNIDNGFGAGYMAHTINARVKK